MPLTALFNLVLVWARQLAEIGVLVAVICVLVPLAIWLWYGKAKPLMDKQREPSDHA